MANEYAAPINHSVGSAVVSTAGGAAGGALRSGLKASFGWIAGLTIAGVVVAATVTALLTAALPVAATIALATVAGVGGGAVGLWGGMASYPFVATIAGIFGAAKGGTKAADEVKQERGAATMLQAQVELAKTQTIAQAQAQAPAQVYQYPPQGSAMNAANTRISIGQDMQYDGLMNGQQLAAAR